MTEKVSLHPYLFGHVIAVYTDAMTDMSLPLEQHIGGCSRGLVPLPRRPANVLLFGDTLLVVE